MPPPQAPTAASGSSRWPVFVVVGLVIIVVAAVAASVAVGSTPPPRPPTIAEPPPTPWEVHLARAGGTKVRWLMPSITGIDGPRSLRHIPEPAIGTFWVSMPETDPLRYDATMLQDVGPAASDPKVLVVDATDRLDGDAPIQFEPVEESDGVAEVSFEEQFDNRIYFGHAYAWRGQVFSLSAAYPSDRVDLRATAQDALRAMQHDLAFAPI